jgi:hypothetical protein
VTVPVARPSARRTVRVAAALVAGQAALCAVIGYVTLGGPPTRGPEAAPRVDPVAIPPLVVPAPTVPPPLSRTTVAPAPPLVARSTTARPRTIARPKQRPELSPTPPSQAPPGILVASSDPGPVPPIPPVTPVPPTPTPAPSTESAISESPAPVPPPLPPSSATQPPVTVGDTCDPADGPGRSADGTAVLCVPGNDGVARWQPA